MTTKPGDTIQPLDLDDLDQVVGGAGLKAAPADHDPAATSDFLASLQGASAAVEAGDHQAGLGDTPMTDPSHHHHDLALAHALAVETRQASHDSAADGHTGVSERGDPQTHDAVARTLGPETLHHWGAAQDHAASVGAHHAGWIWIGSGTPTEGGTANSAWDGALAHHLVHDSGSQHSVTAEEMSQEALHWETRFLDDAGTVGETIQATAPDFLAQTQHLFADRRQALQAIFAAQESGGDASPP